LEAATKPGAAYISQLLELEKNIMNSDLVISGEGKLDEQSLQGKVISEVYKICKKHQKKLLIVTGKNDLGNKNSLLSGIEVISLSENTANQKEAMSKAPQVLRSSLLKYFQS
jgi:glycerate kinase